MRINKPRQLKPRLEPVNYGAKSHGKRKLVKAVMECGLGKRAATLAVDAVIDAWKRAIAAKDRNIEMPLGTMRVTPTPKYVHKKRIARRIDGKLKTWTIFNDDYRITWRLSKRDWEELLEQLNPPPAPQQFAAPSQSRPPGTGESAFYPVQKRG